MIIKKYLLKSESGNEYEFEVTKRRISTNSTDTTDVVDDNGNKISMRQPPKITNITQNVEEEIISAISLPSRKPAIIKIVETQDVSSNIPGINAAEVPNPTGRPKPVRLDPLTKQDGGRPKNINLTKILHQDGASPMIIPTNETIIKADE